MSHKQQTLLFALSLKINLNQFTTLPYLHDIPAQPLIPQVVSAPHSTERREQVVNLNKSIFKQIRTKSYFHSLQYRSPYGTYQEKTISQYIGEVSLSRVNEPEQEETDQRVTILFPALNLEALRVAADTLVPRFIPAIPKIVTKITSKINNISSSAELTQVV
ncbi:Hypothetical_protein [Hexamita inflata]|uniref:Hypothetical_protein n=1 Tax=Hexamita inflata TaxID=28002 RepID=A0AA86QVE4_9EUKA|nr:Hypothetical protein HINF_LOCUS27532 [Hexamita inflata]CAI9963877.1 Hypothetical protein HINF_LOCUS51522 [Hexamita inflata]